MNACAATHAAVVAVSASQCVYAYCAVHALPLPAPLLGFQVIALCSSHSCFTRSAALLDIICWVQNSNVRFIDYLTESHHQAANPRIVAIKKLLNARQQPCEESIALHHLLRMQCSQLGCYGGAIVDGYHPEVYVSRVPSGCGGHACREDPKCS